MRVTLQSLLLLCTLALAQASGGEHAPSEPGAGPALRQPVATLKALFALSRRSLPLYRRRMMAQAAASNAVFHEAPLKARQRAVEKVSNQFGGDASALTDTVRGSLVFPNAESLYRGLEQLRAKEDVVQLRDAFSMSGKLGFKHVNVRLRLPNALVVEVQLTTRPYYDGFHGARGIHPLYEAYRSLTERRALGGLTLTEEARVTSLAARIQERLRLIESN